MVGMIKRFICFTFIAFFISDVVRTIKIFINNHHVKVSSFAIYRVEYNNGVTFYSLAVLYLLIVAIVYFFFNFFRSKPELGY